MSGLWDEGLSWAGGQGGLPRGGGTGATSEGVWREVCGETRGTRPGETPLSQAQLHGTPPGAFPEPCEVSRSRGRPPVAFQWPARSLTPGAAAASVPLSSRSPRQARFTDEGAEHREVKTFARATQLVGEQRGLVWLHRAFPPPETPRPVVPAGPLGTGPGLRRVGAPAQNGLEREGTVLSSVTSPLSSRSREGGRLQEAHLDISHSGHRG